MRNIVSFVNTANATEPVDRADTFDKLESGRLYAGLCTVLSAECAGTDPGSGYVLRLADITGQCFAYATEDLQNVPSTVHVTGIAAMEEDGEMILRVLTVQAAPGFSLRALVRDGMSEPALIALPALLALYSGLRIELQSFVDSVLADPELRSRFFDLPASKSCHHAYPGGLAQHSVSCAQLAGILADASDVFPCEKEAAIVGALLHDIGKIGNLAANYSHPGVRHEDRTLLYVAPALGHLRRENAELAEILTSAFSRHTRARGNTCPVSTIIEAADRIDATTQARAQAAAGAEEWMRILKLDAGGGSNRLYFRPVRQ